MNHFVNAIAASPTLRASTSDPKEGGSKAPPPALLKLYGITSNEPGAPRRILNWSASFVHLEEADGEFIDLFRGTTHRKLASRVQAVLARLIGTNKVLDLSHRYALDLLGRHADALDAEFDGWDDDDAPGVETFMDLVRTRRDRLRAGVQGRLDRGVVDFGDIPELFRVGAEVCSADAERIAGVVKGVNFRSSLFMGTYYEITVEVIHLLAGGPGAGTVSLMVRAFDTETPVEGLPVRLVTPEVKAELVARGAMAARIVGGETHLSYEGNLVQPSWRGDRNYRANGRVIVDGRSFMAMDPDGFREMTYGLGVDGIDAVRKGSERKEETLKADDHWRVFPKVSAFSFAVKKWGVVEIDALRSVNWRTDAFTQLVLPTEEKEMIRALVEHHGGSFEDIVEGKGGGCIFLLHGAPGQGKTLTAEAVAELLHRPLYSVSVGELGTDPKQLEASLRKILDVATTWNAVLLLDEADIFLEARDEKDILRNAMVGVFLRLLEYHQGVMFLTTNRVRNIDGAFFSRISVALKFGDASEEKRAAIWRNLLKAAGVEGIEIGRLSAIPINGRQCKNAIRLAQTLARAKGESVTTDLIEKVVKLSISFQTDMAETLRV